MITRKTSQTKDRKQRVKRYMDEKFGAGFLRGVALDSFVAPVSEPKPIPIPVETKRRR